MPRIRTMHCIDAMGAARALRRVATLATLAIAVVVMGSFAAGAQNASDLPKLPLPGVTDQGAAIVPSAPPGISVTPSTRPVYRPPVQRESDGQPPVEGCPAGEPRKLELLV
jgi:hypothetical protein